MTETALPSQRSSPAAEFLVVAGAWTVGLFGLLRLSLIQHHVILPITRAQAWVAAWGDPKAGATVVITLECSGADVMALLAAAVFAYPATWRRRLTGAAGGLGLLLALNTLRIASLTRVAGTQAFEPLHRYLWPTVLVTATALHAVAWMWSAEPVARRKQRAGRWLVLAAMTTVFFCLFAAVSPMVERTAAVRRTTRAMAAATAGLMSGMGLTARSDGSSLTTARGGFMVTPECLITPLMPVYLAAALVVARTWRRRLAALASFFPVFIVLGFARLLTLALPPAFSGSPLFLIHGFHQLVLGAGVVLVVAFRTTSGATAPPRSLRLLAAATAALVVALAAGGLRGVLELEAGALNGLMPHMLTRLLSPGETQGALLLLPPYQLALFGALWLAAGRWRHVRSLALGLGLLHVGHLALLAALGEIGWHAAMEAPVTLLRAWALLAPLGLFLMLWPRPGAEGQPALQSPLPG